MMASQSTSMKGAVNGNGNGNGGGNSNGSIRTFHNPTLLEKKGLAAARTTTPDSEVLASSDDEHEQQNNLSLSLHSVKSLPQTAQRRPSWMSEVQSSTKQRKFSLGGVSHTSSGSQPTTPLGESGPWDNAPNNGRPLIGGSNNTWTSQFWQKDRPSRLVEVMPSPTTSYHQEDLWSPTNIQSSVPFDFPLEPNRKTIRSQSYSAGQLEKIPGMEHLQQAPGYNRLKSVAHRPSRPSMLGDGPLGSLREDEDDTEHSGGSDHGYPLQTTMSLNSNGRSRAFGYNKIPSPQPNSGFKLQPRAGTFPLSPGSDYAVTDEPEEPEDQFSELGRSVTRGLIGSNASSATNMPSLAAASIESRRLETLRRAQWQTQLGFDITEEGSQSRRHSFAAELPSRAPHTVEHSTESNKPVRYAGYNTMISPFASQFDQSEAYQRGGTTDDRKSPSVKNPAAQNHEVYGDLLQLGQEQERRITKEQHVDKFYAASYFSGMESYRRSQTASSEDYNPFALPNVFSRPQRILYLVVFKCSRADIYYIPENTGLQVKSGDTVIVEGDRGQDLGTVDAGNITMEAAKRLKDEFTRKHYKCLMMFSRMYPHVASIAGDDELFEQAVTASKNAWMSGGGMPGHGPQQDAEPRPKMIKRVARPDEVHLLREKEGNEAKAKRVCQTKVNDHGLRMEILDAEFQHDYRKLTFFYYAEEYINFNELVTDLFKIYKTRIWMSAINPASFNGTNPNTGQRIQQWPKPGAHAPSYLRPQETYNGISENGRTRSPINQDTPAARGNREYERLYPNDRNGAFSGGAIATHPSNAFPGAMAPSAMVSKPSTLPALTQVDYAAVMSPMYDVRRTNIPFSPNASQFTPFAQHYGGMGGVPLQYPFAEPPGNYSIGPPTTGPPNGLSQQPAAFTPRAFGQHSQMGNKNNGNAYPRNNGSSPPGNNGTYQGNSGSNDPNVGKLNDQFQQFGFNSRQQ